MGAYLDLADVAADHPLAMAELTALRDLADSEGTRAVLYLRRARMAEAGLAALHEQVKQADQQSHERLRWAHAAEEREDALLKDAERSDDVLIALDLSPELFRTEGGVINRGKLRAALLHPAEYLPADHWLRQAAKAGVLSGWQLVPIETNWDMRNEGREILIDTGQVKEYEATAVAVYRAMLAAAPKGPDAAIDAAMESKP